jgi:hypothetical protein
MPTDKILSKLFTEHAEPMVWRQNQKGMSGGEELSSSQVRACRWLWKSAMGDVVARIRDLQNFGVHKEHINRLLEPWMFIKVIVSATEWDNFFALRLEDDAQPEIQKLAHLMKGGIDTSTPVVLKRGEWHLPLTSLDDPPDWDTRKKLSVARCARVSYLTHDGKRDIEKDLELYDRLLADRHMSPFEHVATPWTTSRSNFRGWHQHRKEVE